MIRPAQIARALAALVLAAPLAGLCAQQNPSGTASSGTPPPTGIIEGMVISAQTGEPLAHAQIMVFARTSGGAGRLEPREANTDISGRFIVRDLPPGHYRLRADADHFAPQAYGSRQGGGRFGTGTDVTLDTGQHLRDLTFRLMPCGSISGTISDENGKPAAAATVRALPVTPGSGSQEAQTNKQGQYRIADLTPDQYFVQVTFNGRPRETGPSQTYPTSYYPGTSEAETAVPVTVEAGSDTDRIDIDLSPVRAVRVRGQVINPATNQPAQDAWVMLIPRSADQGSRSAAIETLSASRYGVNLEDAQGHFEIKDVPPGSYWAYATVQEKNGASAGRVPVEVGEADVQGLRLPVGAGAQLAARVRVEPETAFDFSRLMVSLNPLEPLISRHQEQPSPAGSFAFQDVEPGTYRLNVQGVPPGFYLKSARLGGSDVLDTGLTVDASTSATPLDIVLASPGGSLSGIVMNDDAPSQATVCLVPDVPRRDRRDLYLRATTRSDGTFSITGIAPGDYKLFAFEDADLRTIFNPALLAPYEAKGESVHVEDGQSVTVRLDVVPADGQP